MNLILATVIDRVFSVVLALFIAYLVIRYSYRAWVQRQVFLYFDSTRRVCMRCGSVHKREHWIIPYWQVEDQKDENCECGIFAIKRDND